MLVGLFGQEHWLMFWVCNPNQQKISDGDAPYKFTGHERDVETGFDYAHARYYHSDVSVFLSVDPLSVLYPNLSPYAYCDNNPVYYIDPDGRTLVPHGSEAFKKQFYKDLKMIAMTDKGKEIVDFLQSPSILINVSESSWAASGFTIHTNSLTYDNDNMFDYDYDGVEYFSFIALGHELKHAYDKYHMEGFAESSRVAKEQSAVSFENYLRSVYKDELAQRGVPFALRYTYTDGKAYFGSRFVIPSKKVEVFNSNMKEIDFNNDLERINSSVSINSTRIYTLGDRHINMGTSGIKFYIKTYESKKSQSHGNIRFLY